MSFIHNMLADAAEKGMKKEFGKLIDRAAQDHDPDKVAAAIKALYNAALFFKPAADASKTPVDDIALRVVMDPLAAEAKERGIEL